MWLSTGSALGPSTIISIYTGGSVVKNLSANAGDTVLIPGLGRSPGEGNGNHSSILAWRIPWTEEPGELQSMGLQRVGREETQAGIKIAGRNINNLRYADDTTLMAESEEEFKSLLMKVQVESEKVGLKLNIQKTKIMASGPTTSWEIDGKTVETVSDFIFLGSKITADLKLTSAMKLKDTCSLEEKL